MIVRLMPLMLRSVIVVAVVVALLTIGPGGKSIGWNAMVAGLTVDRWLSPSGALPTNWPLKTRLAFANYVARDFAGEQISSLEKSHFEALIRQARDFGVDQSELNYSSDAACETERRASAKRRIDEWPSRPVPLLQ